MATKGAKIYSQDFSELLSLLNSECDRRNNDGPGQAAFSTRVEQNQTIYTDSIQTIYQKLLQITNGNQVASGGSFSGTLTNKQQKDKIDAVTLNQYNSTIAGLASVGYYDTPSGCASGCMGLCTGCTGSCTSGCTGTCKDSCSNSCAGSCEGCGDSCSSSCHGECHGCSNAVSTETGECPDSCANSCWSGLEY